MWLFTPCLLILPVKSVYAFLLCCCCIFSCPLFLLLQDWIGKATRLHSIWCLPFPIYLCAICVFIAKCSKIQSIWLCMIRIFIFFPAHCWWYIPKGHRQTRHDQAQRGCHGHPADVETASVWHSHLPWPWASCCRKWSNKLACLW